MNDPAVLIDVAGVSLRIGAHTILQDVSLQVRQGDFTALIGPNGSGKTTLVRIILGLARPEAGTVSLFGEQVDRFSEWGRIGYIPQRAAGFDPLFPASAREVVAMGLLSTKRFPRFLRRSDGASVEEALGLVGMGELGEQRIGTLSGGQQQKIFIARALVSKPAVLILDEPTTGVDSATVQQFYDMLARINREQRITLLMVTHDIGVITSHVSKVACLNQRLVFHGTHDEFCGSPEVVAMFGPEAHLVCHRH